MLYIVYRFSELSTCTDKGENHEESQRAEVYFTKASVVAKGGL